MMMDPAHQQGGMRRSPGAENRTCSKTIRLSPGELKAVSEAARRAGMALSAYIGQVAVDAAEHTAMPVGWLEREIMTELNCLRSQAKEIVGALNSGASLDEDLKSLVRHVTGSIEKAAEKIRRQM
jgi:hypothetical protein